jgi:hypothetical protein
MAKRVTIRANPLDTLVPNPMTRRTGVPPPAAAKAQSADPAAGSTRTTTARKQPTAKASPLPTLATEVTQPPPSADLVNRVQSLEKENEFIKWLVGGAILLAIML